MSGRRAKVPPRQGGAQVVATKGDVPKVLSQRTAIRLLREHGWTLDHGGKRVVKMAKKEMSTGRAASA